MQHLRHNRYIGRLDVKENLRIKMHALIIFSVLCCTANLGTAEGDDLKPCETMTRLIEERLMKKNPRIMDGPERPQCDQDGKFLPKQCLSFTGACWMDLGSRNVPTTGIGCPSSATALPGIVGASIHVEIVCPAVLILIRAKFPANESSLWLELRENDEVFIVLIYLQKLLDVNLSKRLTATEVTSHPWTLGSLDATAPNPTNVLDLMKDYAKEMKDCTNNGELENILIAGCRTSSDVEEEHPLYDIKLTDFGLSVVKGGVGSESMLQSSCGTPVYMAPEVIQNHDYSQQCDIWSIGVILFALLSRDFPFVADKEDKLFELIKRAELDFSKPVWRNISKAAKNLITQLLDFNPARRLTATEVMSHP
ncbi:unnamed protein product [Clavelina lepadiformis]|uniref:Protein kinase domain-containing protein n=1 Tax=Clavelina lepadiformis TaxID=159417 RepID=A0ABP0FWH3_CLALP